MKPTAAEERMHQLLEQYTARVWKEADARVDAGARLAAIVLRKRALSSAASLAVSVQRRLELLSGTASVAADQLRLPFADEDPLPDETPDNELSEPGLVDAALERRLLRGIAGAAGLAAMAESKTTRLLRWLERVREPVIVFTEYRDTLERLERVIRATGRPIVTMHGGMDRRERRRVQDRFNAGGLSLLATDAAAEGLNLHRHCRIVLHYELPWRPARIEQRAGRVDRLGQTRRVHETALVASGTTERMVLAPLALRAARARAAGDSVGLFDALSEAAVAALILGDVPLTPPAPFSSAWFHNGELVREAIEEVQRLEQIRRFEVLSPPRHHSSSGVTISVLDGASALSGLTLVFVLTVVEQETAVHQETLVLRRQWQGVVGRPTVSLLRAVAERWRLEGRASQEKASDQQVMRARSETLERVARVRAAATANRRRRAEGLRAALPSPSQQMVQAGLFDRRALRNHARLEATHDIQLFDLERELPPTDPIGLTATAELAAVLFVRRAAA